MDLHYYVVLAGIVLLISSNVAFADNSGMPWKITIRKNGASIDNTVFWPPELQARQGDTITWTNNDTVSHAVTSGLASHLNYSGKVFDSGILSPGQTYSFKIPQGNWSAYYYFCKIHPWMTGKIDVGEAYLGRSTLDTITTDKKSYLTGDVIQISGAVNDTYQIMPLKIQIFDSQRNLVFSDSINLLKSNSFSYKLKASDSIFKDTGMYKIKSFYGFPATVTDVNFFFSNHDKNTTNNNRGSIVIPYWVKNNAKWWSQNQISDGDFIKTIQFLVTNENSETGTGNQNLTKSDAIPSWIKSDAGMWADGIISDEEFVSSIQYMVDHGIIKT